jgi:DNA-dependent RNA polymerase auxiliary subunit epsilon
MYWLMLEAKGGPTVETTRSLYIALSMLTTVKDTLAPAGMYNVGSISPPITKTSPCAYEGGCIPVVRVAFSCVIANAVMLMPDEELKVIESLL